MSQFTQKEKDTSSQGYPNNVNSSNLEDDDQPGAVAFFRKLKKDGETKLARAVPGILKIIRSPSEPESVTKSAGSPNSSGSPVTVNSGNSNSYNPSSSSSNVTSVKNGIFAPSLIPSSSSSSISSAGRKRTISPYQLKQFEKVLNESDTVDLIALRKVSWNGIPSHFRPVVWQMLLGYLPIKRDRREDTIRRKRKEYLDGIPTYFTVSEADRTTQEGETLRQILVDLPRTCPNNPFFHQQVVRKAMERILYIWSIRHPASGYVQGMNDLLTPLLLTCMQNFVDDPLRCDVASLDPQILVSLHDFTAFEFVLSSSRVVSFFCNSG
jgi:hypothetical protein